VGRHDARAARVDAIDVIVKETGIKEMIVKIHF